MFAHMRLVEAPPRICRSTVQQSGGDWTAGKFRFIVFLYFLTGNV